MGVDGKRLIHMKAIYLLTMLAFINICVADKQQQEVKTIQYESYDENNAAVEAERMMEGLFTIQVSMQAFSKFLGIELTNSGSRFFDLSRKVETLLKELEENVENDIFPVIRVKNWRIQFDNIRTNFHDLTTIDSDPEKIVKIPSPHRLPSPAKFQFAKMYSNWDGDVGQKTITLVQLKQKFASIMKKYRPQMSTSMKPDKNAESIKWEYVPTGKFSPKQVDSPVRRVPKMVQKSPSKSWDEASSTSIFLKPIYIRQRNEWAYVNTGKKLTFEDVNTIQDWFTFRGGISLLQQSIQTIETLDENDDFNVDIDILRKYGALLISSLQQEKISDVERNSNRVKTIMSHYLSVLACFDTVILTHKRILMQQYRSLTKIQLSLPIAHWPNLDPLKPIYAFSEEELAFVSSGKNLNFDEVKELKDTTLLIGGLMLLQDSVKQIDRLGASSGVNSNIQNRRNHLKSVNTQLKDSLSKGHERDSKQVKTLIKKFGGYFNEYINILDGINTSAYMKTINVLC